MAESAPQAPGNLLTQSLSLYPPDPLDLLCFFLILPELSFQLHSHHLKAIQVLIPSFCKNLQTHPPISSLHHLQLLVHNSQHLSLYMHDPLTLNLQTVNHCLQNKIILPLIPGLLTLYSLPPLLSPSLNSHSVNIILVSLVSQQVKNPPAMQEIPVQFLIGKSPWRRDRLPTPVFMGLPGGSDGKESACNAGDLGLMTGLGRSLGGGHGNSIPLFLPGESPWTEEPGGLQSMGSQTVGPD